MVARPPRVGVASPPRGGMVLLLVVLLVAGIAVPAGGQAAVAGPGSPGASGFAQTTAQPTPEPPAVDNTVTRIEVAPDGSARWTVTIRTRLDDERAVEGYEAFQARFRANTSRFLGPFERRIRSVVGSSSEATGRAMAASDFAAETHIQEVPRRWGIVSYSFTWTGFAPVEGDAVVVGDAFVGGFFLAANDTLTVAAPAGYEVATAAPAPDARSAGSATWTGRVDFPDGRPLVRAAPASAGDGGSPLSSTLPGTATLGAAALVLLAALVGLALVVRRRHRSAGGGPSGAGAASPPETLTDEERVVRLLEERGGRVPQAAVVEAFDWSTSKTSRVLGRMAEAGTIEKLQLGRENLIRLPPEDEDGP